MLRALSGLVALGLLTSHAKAAAILTGSATFNTASNDYTYSYSVMNSGTVDDLVLISIPAFSPLGVTGVFAPSGFSLTYDMSQNWVNLMEDGSILTLETFAQLISAARSRNNGVSMLTGRARAASAIRPKVPLATGGNSTPFTRGQK